MCMNMINWADWSGSNIELVEMFWWVVAGYAYGDSCGMALTAYCIISTAQK